jgi:hypothetical protein
MAYPTELIMTEMHHTLIIVLDAYCGPSGSQFTIHSSPLLHDLPQSPSNLV